jgi:hypothetical protein
MAAQRHFNFSSNHRRATPPWPVELETLIPQ